VIKAARYRKPPFCKSPSICVAVDFMACDIFLKRAFSASNSTLCDLFKYKTSPAVPEEPAPYSTGTGSVSGPKKQFGRECEDGPNLKQPELSPEVPAGWGDRDGLSARAARLAALFEAGGVFTCRRSREDSPRDGKLLFSCLCP